MAVKSTEDVPPSSIGVGEKQYISLGYTETPEVFRDILTVTDAAGEVCWACVCRTPGILVDSDYQCKYTVRPCPTERNWSTIKQVEKAETLTLCPLRRYDSNESVSGLYTQCCNEVVGICFRVLPFPYKGCLSFPYWNVCFGLVLYTNHIGDPS
jgi:hypothetical protein